MASIGTADSKEAAVTKRHLMRSVKTLVLRALPAHKTLDDGSDISVNSEKSQSSGWGRNVESKRKSEPVFSTRIREHFSYRSPQSIDMYLTAMSASRPVVCGGEKRAESSGVAVKSNKEKLKSLARALQHPFPLPSDCPSDVDMCELSPVTTRATIMAQRTASRSTVTGQPSRVFTTYQRSSDGALLIRVDSDGQSITQSKGKTKRAYQPSRLAM